MVEQYEASRVVIRLSQEANVTPSTFADQVYRIARDTATLLGVDGYNITNGDGYWKGERENGSNIEIVTKRVYDNDVRNIREYVLREGLTAFVTIDPVTAYELY